MSDRKRVVITGLGVCVAGASNVAEFYRNLVNGVSGVGPITDFDVDGYRSQRAGVVTGLANGIETGDADLDRAYQLVLKSTGEALADAELTIDPALALRTAVCIGTSLGGMHSHVKRMRDDFDAQRDTEFDRAYPDLLEIPPCQIANLVGHRIGARGGNATVVTACSAGSNSIAVAMDWIREGRADVVVAGASDPLCELSYSGFNILMALSPTSSRPFDRNRDGLVVGEGGGTLILEEYEHALARGAHIYAELTGYGLSNDGYHQTQPDPEAGGAVRAIQRALDDASLTPMNIDYINAHGTATKYNDQMELRAISRVYGAAMADVPVSSIKSMIGHTLGAAGTIEAIATVLALKHKFLPPTINSQERVEEYEYDFVPQARTVDGLTNACSHSFGFGGNAACLVLREVDGAPAKTGLV